MKPDTLEIFGLPIFSGTAAEFRQLLTHHLKGEEQLKLVATPNPEQIVLAQENPYFQATLRQFDRLIPDGVGLIKASCLLKRQGKLRTCLKERITGVDVVSWLLEFAARDDLKVLLVGGRELAGLELKIKDEKFKIVSQRGVNKDRRWKTRLARLEEEAGLSSAKRVEDGRSNLSRGKVAKVVYWVEGYKNKTQPTKTEEQEVANIITKLKPDIVLVALGAPEQEFWLIDHRRLLESVGVRLGMVVGGAFDMLTNQIPRAPEGWQRLGLEWLWRLVQEPWRLRRQLKLLKFVWLTLRPA